MKARFKLKFPPLLWIVFFAVLGSIAAARETTSSPTPVPGRLTSAFIGAEQSKIIKMSPGIPPREAEEAIKDLAAQVIQRLQARDLAGLAQWVDPARGIDLGGPGVNVHLDSAQLAGAFADPAIRDWGTDWPGNPIRCTFARYYVTQIFPKDFSQAVWITYNNYVLMAATSNPFYRDDNEDSITVEYILPGSDPKRGGMDRQSLAVLFELDGQGRWCASRIYRDYWTP